MKKNEYALTSFSSRHRIPGLQHQHTTVSLDTTGTGRRFPTGGTYPTSLPTFTQERTPPHPVKSLYPVFALLGTVFSRICLAIPA